MKRRRLDTDRKSEMISFSLYVASMESSEADVFTIKRRIRSKTRRNGNNARGVKY